MKNAEDSDATSKPVVPSKTRRQNIEEVVATKPADAFNEVARVGGAVGVAALSGAVIGGIDPLLGSMAAAPMAAIIDRLLGNPAKQRINSFLWSVATDLTLLENRVDGFDLETRLNDPAFLSIVAEVCQIALRNHREEKLIALRNAVLNSASEINVEEDVRFAFLALIDRFTASHLDVLSFAYYPRGWIDRNGAVAPHPLPKGWSAQETCLLEYQKNPLFLDMVVADLIAARLIEAHPFTALDNSVSPGRTSQNYTSDLGKQFYRFFDTPDCLKEQSEQ